MIEGQSRHPPRVAWPLFVVALRERRRTKLSDSSNLSVESDGFTLEQCLELPNTRLINADIVTIPDMGTLRACVAYENANQRIQFLR